MPVILRNGVSWAGLGAGPAAWALSTQASSLVPWACIHHGPAALVLTCGLLALVALAGAALSWQAWRTGPGQGGEGGGRPRSFLAGIGVGAGVLFAVVIVTQGTAVMVLDACLR